MADKQSNYNHRADKHDHFPCEHDRFRREYNRSRHERIRAFRGQDPICERLLNSASVANFDDPWSDPDQGNWLDTSLSVQQACQLYAGDCSDVSDDETIDLKLTRELTPFLSLEEPLASSSTTPFPAGVNIRDSHLPSSSAAINFSKELANPANTAESEIDESLACKGPSFSLALRPVDSCKQLGNEELKCGNTPSSSYRQNSEWESSDMENDNDSESPSVVDQVKTILGPEYACLALFVLDTLAPRSFEELSRSAIGFVQSANGSETTQASSSQLSGNDSPPSMNSSDSSRHTKRKYPADDDDDDDRDDGREGQPNRSRMRRGSMKWDCPVFRKPVNLADGQQPSYVSDCTPGGLEFRYLWEHLKKKHLGCETCGLKLEDAIAATGHLLEKQENPLACQPNLHHGQKPDIGVKTFLQMESLYRDRRMTDEQKWIQWWELLHGNGHDVPDGRHQGTISIPAGNIKKLQAIFQEIWTQEAFLPPLDEEQMRCALAIFEKTIRFCPLVQRQRRQRTQRQIQQPRPTPVASAPLSSQNELHVTLGKSPVVVIDESQYLHEDMSSSVANFDFESFFLMEDNLLN